MTTTDLPATTTSDLLTALAGMLDERAARYRESAEIVEAAPVDDLGDLLASERMRGAAEAYAQAAALACPCQGCRTGDGCYRDDP